MNKDRVVFFPILGKWASKCRASLANRPESGLSGARGPSRIVSLLTAPYLQASTPGVQVVCLSYSIRIQFPSRLPYPRRDWGGKASLPACKLQG